METTMTADAPPKGWFEARKTSLIWIGAGVTFAIACNVAAWFLWPSMTVAEPLDRLLLAVQCCGGIGIVALVLMQGLWRAVDTEGAEDPFANKESHAWKINQRVFSNTVEQAIIFAPIFLALSLRMQPEHAYMLPAMMTIWCVGRLLFWAGYRYKLEARAIGMDMTSITCNIAGIWLIATLF